MALIDCPYGHQFSNHASNNCPYCSHEKSISGAGINRNLHSNQGDKGLLSVSSRGSSTSVHRPHIFGAILKCFTVVIVITIALMVSHRLLIKNPSTEPTTATSTEPVVSVGTCLKITSAELNYDLPSNWSSQTISCDQSDAFVKIIKIQNSSESIEECKNAKWCLWVPYDGFDYQYTVIPHVGQCFYGYVNTAWPDKGGSGEGIGWAHYLTQCGTSFPEWAADKSTVSTLLGVEETFLKPVQYRIEKLDVDNSGACEKSYFEVVYSPEKVTNICVSIIDSAPAS